MTHEQLRVRAMRWLKNTEHCSVVLSELVTVAREIPDAIGWKYGKSVVVECKASRSDFLRDRLKVQKLNGSDVGQRMFYMAEAGIIRRDELPEDIGLLEVGPKIVTVVKQARFRELSIGAHQNEKYLLLSTISRIRCREFLLIGADDIHSHLPVEPDTQQGEEQPVQ